jgi:hypothetical protein
MPWAAASRYPDRGSGLDEALAVLGGVVSAFSDGALRARLAMA